MAIQTLAADGAILRSRPPACELFLNFQRYIYTGLIVN